MPRFAMTGLRALVLFASWTEYARAGSVDIHLSKAGVEAARIRLYEHEMNLRAQDPASFDRKHPVLGKLLTGEKGLDDFLRQRTFHHGLLCVHTPFIWRVVDGDILYHKKHPFGSLPLIPGGGPAFNVDNGPGASASAGGGSGAHGTGGSGDTFHPSSVPEPSAWVLMASGLVLALVAFARRRGYRLLATHRPVTV